MQQYCCLHLEHLSCTLINMCWLKQVRRIMEGNHRMGMVGVVSFFLLPLSSSVNIYRRFLTSEVCPFSMFLGSSWFRDRFSSGCCLRSWNHRVCCFFLSDDIYFMSFSWWFYLGITHTESANVLELHRCDPLPDGRFVLEVNTIFITSSLNQFD